MARRLQFVTAHARAGEELNLDWKAMADPDATLVVYMGRAAAAEVAERLIEAGLDAATPVMVGANASLSQERRFSTRLDQLGLEIGRASCRDRVCQYVYISVVAVVLKKKKT